jgi:heptosyltransferase-2
VLPALRRRHPEAKIEVLAPRAITDVFQCSPEVQKVVGITASDEVDAYRRGRYDRAILGPESFGAAWRAFRGGVPERMGFATSHRGPLLSRSLTGARASRARHQVENYRELASLDGDPYPTDAPRVFLEERWAGEAQALWPEDSRPRVALQPGAAYGPAKRWFPDRFAKIAHLLSERGYDVALVGGPGDREVVSAVKERCPATVADLSGRTGVGVLGAILSRAKLLVTNDTGPMHLAAAVGTPTLALFGSTNPIWTRPFGERHRVLRESVPCSPCYQRTCRFGAVCFERLGVERVFRDALEMLEGTA